MALLANKYPRVAVLDRPTSEWRQSRRAQSLSGVQIKAGMMPRTANGISGDETVQERPTIVGGVGSNRKNLCPAAHQKHQVAVAMTDQLAPVW
ncbi:hypothetical protein RGCCGE502_30802 (plasmid) [Rhizobium grahamii CCGE 502]|uniref:Uncharacterized protein n=1 Tax=Rhizobium grahamii CCGE 502 TaxID=990285 RepID=S3I3C7_9HYPH|nr:hypothetical protein RGCCGE502_30802 [Rhizobium grahamii CCGE 502]